ncbi:membrane protein insertase YidC [Bacillus sp. CGMCC 1.16607]|uniref:membrane protein insertase YidC n=1 Tax=Bacillus sp. CGMCC 1.16607 TaxID=3351842 RepID=UPI003631782E
MKKYYVVMMTILIFTLTGCSAQSGNDPSFFQHFLVGPFKSAIHFTANLFGGSFGIAIILLTLAVRFALLPLMLKQYKNQAEMKGKMDRLKPEMDDIQKRLKAEKDKLKQQEIQREMFGLYKKHNVNPMSIGCLPLLLQMPILMGFYYAIRGSEEIASHSFLWFSLGQPDIVITLIAGVAYYFQFKVSQANMPIQQQQQMKFMGLLSPIMIVVFSFKAPAALPLYWTVGGVFLIIQTIIGRKMYPSVKQEELPEKQQS